MKLCYAIVGDQASDRWVVKVFIDKASAETSLRRLTSREEIWAKKPARQSRPRMRYRIEESVFETA